MYAKKAFVLVLTLLIVNNTFAQSFQYDTQGRLISNNTMYDPKGRMVMSAGKTYYLPQFRANEYNFGGLTYNLSLVKIKSIRTSNINPYTDIHQDPIKLYSSLYYLNAREYMPSIKRFIQMDSWDIGNRYQYAKGNPIKYTDPSGHLPKILEWFLPTTNTEWAVLGLSLLLGAIGDWYLITKLLPGKGKLPTLLSAGIFNGTFNAGIGYLGNGIGSGNWKDTKRLPINFGIGFIEGLIIGNKAHKKGMKVKLKKDKIKNDIKLKNSKTKINKKLENKTFKQYTPSDILLGEVIERYKAANVGKTNVIKDKTSYLFKTKKNVTSIDFGKIESLTKSKLKNNLLSPISNSKFIDRPKNIFHSSYSG